MQTTWRERALSSPGLHGAGDLTPTDQKVDVRPAADLLTDALLDPPPSSAASRLANLEWIVHNGLI